MTSNTFKPSDEIKKHIDYLEKKREKIIKKNPIAKKKN